MIVCNTFPTAQECVRFMRSKGLTLGDVVGPAINNSGHYDIFWDDESEADTIIDTSEGVYGVAYGDVTTNVALVGATLELKASRTSVAGGALAVADGTQVTAGTLAGGYIIPGSVSIPASGDAPALVDDGYGYVVEETTRTQRGTIDYSTRAVSITWESVRKAPANAAAITASYQHTTLPDTDDIPDEVELSRLVIERTSGTATINWYLYEESAAAYAPIASGAATFAGASYEIEDLTGLVSVILESDLSKRGRRWLKIVPTVNDSQFRVRATFRRERWS